MIKKLICWFMGHYFIMNNGIFCKRCLLKHEIESSFPKDILKKEQNDDK